MTVYRPKTPATSWNLTPVFIEVGKKAVCQSPAQLRAHSSKDLTLPSTLPNYLSTPISSPIPLPATCTRCPLASFLANISFFDTFEPLFSSEISYSCVMLDLVGRGSELVV